MPLDPAFNEVPFSTFGFVPNVRIEFGSTYRNRQEASAGTDFGIQPDARMQGRFITIEGVIAQTTDIQARDQSKALEALLNASYGVEKKGRLSLHGDGHYYCQVVGPFSRRTIPGQGKIQVGMTFFADDPFRRADVVKSVVKTPTFTVPQVAILHGAGFDYQGDAYRIPLVINAGGNWLKDEVFRCRNILTGDWTEVILDANLLSTEDLIIDGENGEVRRGTTITYQGFSGRFPYLRGGAANTYDFTGSDRFQQQTFIFWDRFVV